MSAKQKVWALRIFTVAAVLFLGATILNASWIAPDPAGEPKLIAHRGVAQLQAGSDACGARGIEQPVHDFTENTTRSIGQARLSTAQLVEVDVRQSADGALVLFGDDTLDCRTDGEGAVSDRTLEELEALDVGYGYSADGTEFPLRGNAQDAIPTLEQALAASPRDPLLFHLTGDAASADVLAQHLEAAERDVRRRGDAFYGNPAAVARMREIYPENWAFTLEDARSCASSYKLYGWTGILPASCKGGTMAIPLDGQFLFWGWPNRLIDRMESAGGRVLVVAGDGAGGVPGGLVLPEQLGDIPSSFNGYIWVDDIWTVGPSLRPSTERRTREEQLRAREGITRRRERLD